MGYCTGILAALQDHRFVVGRDLFPYAGWETRGFSDFSPVGSVNHHTAGPLAGDLPSLRTVLYGRPDLPYTLANAMLSRSAAIHLLAAGTCTHAGVGNWGGISGNLHFWGLEVEHIGYPSEAVTEARWDAMYRWHAACADYSGFTSTMVCQHSEFATPPGRKSDFVKPITDPNLFRERVAAAIAPPPPTPTGDPDMAIIMDIANPGYPPRLFDGPRCSALSPATVVTLTQQGVVNAGLVPVADYAHAVAHALHAQGRPTEAARWSEFALTGKMPPAT